MIILESFCFCFVSREVYALSVFFTQSFYFDVPINQEKVYQNIYSIQQILRFFESYFLFSFPILRNPEENLRGF